MVGRNCTHILIYFIYKVFPFIYSFFPFVTVKLFYLISCFLVSCFTENFRVIEKDIMREGFFISVYECNVKNEQKVNKHSFESLVCVSTASEEMCRLDFLFR